MSGERRREKRSVARLRHVLIALSVLLLGALIGTTSASAEPNDTLTGASGPIRNGTTYQGVIATENDVDWWVFYTGVRTQVDIALTGLGPEDCLGPAMELTDTNGTWLAERVRIERNETQHILYTVEPGTNYVKVERYGGGCFGPEALYHLWINSSSTLLAEPPYIPPPPPPSSPGSQPEPSSACRAAQQRAASLRSRLRHASSRRQRNRLRAKLRQARSTAASLC